MENFIITNHAIIRRYQRFDFLDKFESDILRKKIELDLSNIKNKKPIGSNVFNYKTKDAVYIVKEKQSELIVITTYKLTDYKNIFDPIILESRIQLDDLEYACISTLLSSEDIIIAKNLGFKKLVFVNDELFLLSKDISHDKIIYTIFKKWTNTDLSNEVKIKNIKQEYFLNSSIQEWERFLDYIGLLEKVKHKFIRELEELPEELKLYKSVLDGNISRFPKGFWIDDDLEVDRENAKQCTIYMFEKVLNWNEYDIYNNLTADTFKENKLNGMLSVVFEDDIFFAIDNAYPGKIKPWLFKKYNYMKYWDKDSNGLEHAKMVIHEWFLPHAAADGYIINNSNLLGFDWEKLLKKYYIKGILSITFKNSLIDFFKEIFGVEFNEGVIEQYELKFSRGAKEVKLYR